MVRVVRLLVGVDAFALHTSAEASGLLLNLPACVAVVALLLLAVLETSRILSRSQRSPLFACIMALVLRAPAEVAALCIAEF